MSKRKRCSIFGALLIVGTAFSVPTYAATIIFSNLVQPGDQYGPDPLGIGHTPAFPAGVSGYSFGATRFTPSATSRLVEIMAPLGYDTGPNMAEVFLMSDIGGLPGTAIESFTIENLPPAAGPIGLIGIQSVSMPLLTSGQQYWLAATGGPDTFALWALTLFQGDPSDGAGHRIIWEGTDSGWSAGTGARTGALVIVGIPIPEPGSLALLSSGLVSIILLRRWIWRRIPV